MEADNSQCAFGGNCRYFRQNRCNYYHPDWQYSQRSNQTQNHCFNGPDCWYLKQGRCHFYHPPNEQSNPSSRIPNNSNETCPNPLLMKELKQRLEYAEIRRQQILRIIQIQNLLEANRIKNVKKSNPQNFEWYFSKNKTFKAMDVSEEKLKELDQCIICYISFSGESIDQNDQLQREQNYENKIESKIESCKTYLQKGLNKRKSKDQKLINKQQSHSEKQHLQKQLTQLYCKHTFHKECIKKWLSTTENCPICRKDFKDHEDYKKWEQEKKQLKSERKSIDSVGLSADRQYIERYRRRIMVERFQPEMDSYEDEEYQGEEDYEDYEDYEMWDVDGDDEY